MVSRKVNFLPTILLILEAYHTSAFHVGLPYTDVVVPIPEVSVTIGGTMTAYPVQHEELYIHEDSFYADIPQPNSYIPTFPVPQQPQIIILDDAEKKNNSNLLLLLLLLGNKGSNNNGCGKSNSNCCCPRNYDSRPPYLDSRPPYLDSYGFSTDYW